MRTVASDLPKPMGRSVQVILSANLAWEMSLCVLEETARTKDIND
jgi:hypothetical protein